MMSAIVVDRNVSSVYDFFTLLKPGVMSLVVFTGLVGLLLAPGSIHPFNGFLTVLCIAVGSGAGAALNMWYDRDIDAIMRRTQKRPLPMGRIAHSDALALGVVLSLFSVMLMGLAANWIAAGLLAFAIFFYAVVYTVWLKRSTPQNIVIGGAAGAFPPMIGWAAVTSDITWDSVILFLIIFLWTPPHFWALALYRSTDYAKAGVPMLPVVAGLRETKKQILLYSLLLVGASLLPCFSGKAGEIYLIFAACLGANFLLLAWHVWKDETDISSRTLFGYSILYLFLLFAALLADHFLPPIFSW